MKISRQKSNSARHSKPLFVLVNIFQTDFFPVRVNHLRLAKSTVSKAAPGAGSPDRRVTAPRQRPNQINPIDVASESFDTVHRISRHL
jgi:hypothetical protein